MFLITTYHCPGDHFNVRHQFIPSTVFHSLGRDFAVLLDMDMVIGLKDADFVIRELDPANQSATAGMKVRDVTHVKPFIRENSCLISPPDDLAFSLALVSSSSLAFSFKVTCTT